MEALLEKEGDVENWNDERMDELSRRVDDGFREMREGFARVDKEMKQGFARVDAKFDKLFYLQFAFMGSLVIGLLTLVVGLLTDRI
jgi:phosphate uptake regulator